MDAQSDVNAARLRTALVQERSGHTALVDRGVMYVWGGFRSVLGEEVVFPSDEIYLYDMRSGKWKTSTMEGEVPPLLSRSCGCYLKGTMYIFGGCDENVHSNQLYYVNLRDESYIWKKVTDSLGALPTPRDRHSCWVYKDRLFYFGGYGCKQIREVRNNSSFIVDEASWAVIGNAVFRFWGWNNELHVYDPRTNMWTEPQTSGVPPTPRAAHASAAMGSKGYICGGTENMKMDIHCIDMESWTWTNVCAQSAVPTGRSWHTFTALTESTAFLFGGLSPACQPLGDGWIFDTRCEAWKELGHAHKTSPRLWHSACLGIDSDIIAFGGTSDYRLSMDTISVLRIPSTAHCSDVLVFQTQPYTLLRLCEDCIGKNARALQDQLGKLPPRVQEIVEKKICFFMTGGKHQDKTKSTQI